jgi:hypothetical protein
VKQSCPYGLTSQDLDEVLGPRRNAFDHWMRGQTVMACDGKRYSHDIRQYLDDSHAGSPHGIVTYASDVKRFLAGLPVID